MAKKKAEAAELPGKPIQNGDKDDFALRVEHVRVLNLVPGDVLVLKSQHNITREEIQQFQLALTQHFGFRVPVFSGDFELEVVRNEKRKVIKEG